MFSALKQEFYRLLSVQQSVKILKQNYEIKNSRCLQCQTFGRSPKSNLIMKSIPIPDTVSKLLLIDEFVGQSLK